MDDDRWEKGLEALVCVDDPQETFRRHATMGILALGTVAEMQSITVEQAADQLVALVHEAAADAELPRIELVEA